MTERHYWDTTCWIDLHNEPKVGPVGPMRTLWLAVERGAVELLFSAVTLAEVLIKPEGVDPPKPWPDPNDFDVIFDSEQLIAVQVDRLVGERARSIRRQTGLKTPDAIHLACALEHNVDHLITRDPDILTRHGVFFRRDGKAISVLTPANALGGPLLNQ